MLLRENANRFTGIPDDFKKGYLKQIKLRELVISTQDVLLEKLQTDYKLLYQYKQKSITNIIKDFLNSTAEEQILLLTLFLLKLFYDFLKLILIFTKVIKSFT